MVKSVIDIGHGHQVTVELVGPAGAGKTTISRLLRECDRGIGIGPDIELRNIKHASVFFQSIPSSVLLYSRHRPNRQLTWDELKTIAYLKGWDRFLKQQASGKHRVLLLDQGPVFRLATLREFGPESMKGKAFEPWWSHLYQQWASALDVIVWLDTSDSILMQRINTRHKQHEIKGRSELEMTRYLARYRNSYRDVLTKLASYPGPIFLEFDTHQVPVAQIADEILMACRSMFVTS